MSDCGEAVCVQTHYPDGTVVHAHVQRTPEDEARAAALGYESIEAMTLEHDRLHHAIEWAMLGRTSLVPLDAEDPVVADALEHVVLAVARLLNVVRSR